MENEKKIKVVMLEPGKLARTAEIDVYKRQALQRHMVLGKSVLFE